MRWTAKPDTKTDRPSGDAIQCDEFVIARTRHSGEEMFTLYRRRDVIGHYDTAARAKAAAKERAK